MEELEKVTQYLDSAVFSALALMAFFIWRRNRSEAAAWFTAALAVLALVVDVGLILPDDGEGLGFQLLTKALVCVLLLFPYFLYRFSTAFVPPSRRARAIADGITLLVIIVTLFVPSFPGENDPQPDWFGPYVLLILVQWTYLLVAVAVRLWRAGKGQPTIARRRMRLLAVAATALNIALAIGVRAPDPSLAVQLISQAFTLSSGLAFYLGFAPPELLRAIWRRTEQTVARDAMWKIASAVSHQEVADAVLPHAARLVGGRGAAFLDESGTVVSAVGISLGEVDRIAELERSPDDNYRSDVARVELPNGSLVVWASPYTPFFANEEVSLLRSLGSFVAISFERIDFQERERKALHGLRKANEEIESFVYSVSHDLNTPLVSILGYLDYLIQDFGPALPEDGRMYLERMGASARYMQALIRDLLELSRVGRAQTEEQDVDLNDVIAEIEDEFAPSYPQLEISASSLPVIRINGSRARQLFTNLIKNSAIHGSEERVRVAVDAHTTENGAVCVSVKDDGRGIPEAYRERIFGVFERLESSGTEGGTGIGLAICRRIVDAVGGSIWAAPSQEGAEIRITFPQEVVRARKWEDSLESSS